MYIRVGLLQYIIDLCIRKHSGSAAPRGPPVIARHLVYCIVLQFVSMRWVHFHLPPSPACVTAHPCGAVCHRVAVL